uniref:Vitellogenin domain-containing protein n=1 Tax=Pygocentrus nattereri TaxID=42514 RepID=A0AAR2KQD5_PYGNA
MFCLAALTKCIYCASKGPRLDDGRLYRFRYGVELGLNHPKGTAKGSAGFQFSSDVDISLAWRNPENQDDQLLRVQISNFQIQNVAQRSRKNNIFHDTTTESILGREKLEALQRPFMLLWRMGKVRNLYTHKAEPMTVKNLKRGVASMLMMQLNSGKMIEVMGDKHTTNTYNRFLPLIIIINIYIIFYPSLSLSLSLSQVLGVSEKSTSVTVITLQDGFIKSAVAEETHVLSTNAHQTTALMDTWKAIRGQLEPKSLSKSSAPRSFLTLIQQLRKASKAEILKVLRNCSKTALPQLVDAVTSAQTASSLSAMLEFLDFSKADGMMLQERFLYACGFASHPTESMLQALLDISKGKIGSNDIKESVVIIMGALVQKLCRKGGCDLPVSSLYTLTICFGDEAEVQMYLLALKNSLLPEAIPLLARYAESETGAFSTIAITALQRYDPLLITSEVRQALNRVYHQNRRVYEKNVRAAAADVILSSSPSYMEVRNLLLSIGHLPHEMNKYMLSKVQDIMRFEMPASKLVQKAMEDMMIHNYDRFSKLGSSSAYSGFMTRGGDVVSTYSLDILYSGSGIMRRSIMNIFGQSNGALLHGLQVAIEAQGLESLIAATPDEGEEDLESFAGMSALLMDVQLRPVTFFKGYSDLMSKMFSMSGDPINVVKGLILLTDHSQVIPLQSGLRAAVEFQGGLGIDISGGMEFSLWYRESKTSVNNRGALVVVGNVTVDADFLSVSLEVSFDMEAALDFITTVQFSNYPFLVCMQMDKTTFPFRESVSKVEKLASGEPFTWQRSREQLVPGSEFPLHQENSNMCKKVFDSSW